MLITNLGRRVMIEVEKTLSFWMFLEMQWLHFSETQIIHWMILKTKKKSNDVAMTWQVDEIETREERHACVPLMVLLLVLLFSCCVFYKINLILFPLFIVAK